ncbi:MAG: imidazole glycerol phosphate synthase subunit HisH [Flavobacteriaceae bacterium]|nr:imidazole glycerol phosphate synthase subunit HisH [Flavobacteriaceae bacterium]
MNNIVIIDYGAGNIQSIKFALKRLGYDALLTNDFEIIKHADKVIFPGVGEAASAMDKLIKSGLHQLIPQLKQPVLGICLGMQLLCNHSEEGNTNGLSVFDVNVKKFPKGEKIPQIGWNQIESLQGELFKGIEEREFMYLVHSFYVPINNNTIATTNYGFDYATALQKDNFYGVQFHPEKSSYAGERILNNFLELVQ